MLNNRMISTMFLSLVCSVGVSACTAITSGNSGPPHLDDALTHSKSIGATNKITADFVNALKQIPTHAPASSTVQFLSTDQGDEFTVAFHDEIRRAGFAVRWIDGQLNDNLFQYRRVIEDGIDSMVRQRFEIAVGHVELRRTYVGDSAADVMPVTPLYIRGADATHVVLNDAVFTQVVSAPSKRESTLSVPDNANPLSVWARGASPQQQKPLPLVALPSVRNVFELGGSNYSDALSNHTTLVERILTFPNDSLRLGDVNKQIIYSVVSAFNPETDIFSVLGCSLGPTALSSGNAALALGRASRVSEALLFAGIDPDKILDEGCWAGDSTGNTLPRRGVVLTLNRRT